MRMTHRISAVLVAALAISAAACGRSVTVEVTTEGADGAAQPQGNLPLEFLPFNRDSVFDALDAQAETPRPQMSDDLEAASQRVTNLQTDWREAENEWSATRDSLRQLRDRLDQLDSRDPNYRQLYDEFGRIEGRERQLDRARKAAFDSFTTAQNQVSARLDSFKVVRDTWADEAYAGYYDIETQLLDGREIIQDTTSEQGTATVSLPGGDWWVTTRTPVAQGELYWNLQIPDVDTLRLDESNGELRPRI